MSFGIVVSLIDNNTVRTILLHSMNYRFGKNNGFHLFNVLLRNNKENKQNFNFKTIIKQYNFKNSK